MNQHLTEQITNPEPERDISLDGVEEEYIRMWDAGEFEWNHHEGDELGKKPISVMRIWNNFIAPTLTITKKEAFENGQIDGINGIREENYLVPKRDMRYVQNCRASDNRKWIEPRMRALEEAEAKGISIGYSKGYNDGYTENKIIPENCK